MAITEVFPNPTVTEVHFEIRFPSLLYLEKRIGDLQLRIMAQFPQSKEIFTRQLLLAQLPQGEELPEDLVAEQSAVPVRKSWKFFSEHGVEVDVSLTHLGLKATEHKTYNNAASDNKFRDTIQFVMGAFLDVGALPVISRVGLRYVDHCPLDAKTGEAMRRYYHTSFPLERFPLETADAMAFSATVTDDDIKLKYTEQLAVREGVP